jgi:hypothetical protein
MPKEKRSLNLLYLGLAAGGLVGFAVGRRSATSQPMPHLRIWQKALAEHRGEFRAAILAGRVQARYDELYASRPRFPKRILRIHLDMLILPGLALYQTLLEENDDAEAVLAEMESIFETTFNPLFRFMLFVDRAPRSFSLFRRTARITLKHVFPPEGWETKIVEDSDRALAFNMHSCLYLDVLAAYGAPQLTPLYCRMDELLYEKLPALITWERTKTLGRGSDCCDFRWSLRDEMRL